MFGRLILSARAQLTVLLLACAYAVLPPVCAHPSNMYVRSVKDQPPASTPDSLENIVGSIARKNLTQISGPPSVVDNNQAIGRTAVAAKQLPVNERYPQAVLLGPTCGGTIISDKWILTAAHCTLFTRGRYVIAGTNNTIDGSGQTIRVKRLVVHPLFTVGPYWLNVNQYDIKQVSAHYDFLLAELQSPLPLDGKTMVAARLDGPTLAPGTPVAYAGYGAEHHGETMRHDMHLMELEIVSDTECAQHLSQFDPKDMICSRGRPPKLDSACNGDSGSGLLHDGVLVGVLSWVEDDARECRRGAVVVSARVSAVRDWIRQVTGI